MLQFDSTRLKLFLMVLLLGTVPEGFGQQYANFTASTLHPVNDIRKTIALRIEKDRFVSLKMALENLKHRFHLKFAYREGLLDGKMISASWLEQEDAPEIMLKNILSLSSLQFKRINKRQISIFSGEANGHLNAEGKANPADSSSSLSVMEVRTSQLINGKVTAQGDGEGLPGVSIVLKGTATGTTTDADGNFKLSIPDEGGTIVFSFIGFATQEIAVSNRTTVDVVMVPESKTLNEVVVTALGIEKSKSALGYSVTEVKGEEFTQARENNVANALTGKIAGVNATGLSTGPGGSSRIIIRGNGSLNGDNQPLYVVNGMPIDNTVPGGAPTVNGITFNVDRGDGVAGINPDDIESISVLKGGTAAALYGSRASNGVILITTKKGRVQKGIGVEYNSTATFDNVAVNPDYQYQYGQGDGGVKPTTLAASQATGRRSWGSKIDGSTDYVGVDGKTHPYTAKKNNFQNYYQTGSTYTNSVAFSGGSDAVTYRFSAADLNSKGILPNTTYDRKTLNLSLNGKLNDRISVELLAQYNLETGHNRTGAGDALGNPNWTPLEIANTADVRWLNPGYDSLGNETIWNDAAIASNGYFVINKYKEVDTKNRFIGQASVAYQLFKDLVFKATISRDFYNYNYTNVLPTGTLYVPNGQYTGLKSDVSETNGLVTGTYKTRFGNNIGFSVLGGVNGRKFQNSQLTLNGSNFTIPYFYSFANLATASTVPYTAHTATNSVFGSVDLDYKSLFFLTFTGRQDWFSTLSPKNNKIFIQVSEPA